MIDYTVGDKVVCIDDTPVDFRKIMRYRVIGFQYPQKGEVYTVRDMAPPEAFIHDNMKHPGVLLHEVTAGTGSIDGDDNDRDELWYNAKSFRKALPSDFADCRTTRQLQPA